MAEKQLPKKLFVKRVVEENLDCFEASEKKAELWEDMVTWTTVGEYRLVKTTKIKGTVVEK